MKLLKKKKINLIILRLLFFIFFPTLSNFFVNDSMSGYGTTCILKKI